MELDWVRTAYEEAFGIGTQCRCIDEVFVYTFMFKISYTYRNKLNSPNDWINPFPSLNESTQNFMKIKYIFL